ncbi:MAG: phosphoglucomutase, partial [Flavobacteriales bacterium]|nr:phosphoglucomutase [Flavobacteriales bacterium]
FLKSITQNKEISVVIGHDCRNNGKKLQEIVCNVFSSNGIKVYIFDSLRPTPLISFAVRNLKCNVGIVLTASHNPPEYNGYKVYWDDGGQIVPPIDQKLMSEIEDVNYGDIKFEGDSKLIQVLDNKIDEDYIDKVISHKKSIINNTDSKKLKIVFTSLHGTSYKLIPEILNKSGFKNLMLVENQMKPDGNFTNVNSSNPENPNSLKEAIEIAKNNNCDLVLGTDPDADRFGIAVKDLSGDYIHINGNQSMVVMTDYIISKFKGDKNNSFIGSTVVSTPMMKKIAKKNNVKIMLSLTGFKWIGKMINDHNNLNFICGGEESFGFLSGDFVRDKDAVTSALIISEICNELNNIGSSFFESMIDCYIKYGFYKEKLVTQTEMGNEGSKKIREKINSLRNNPPRNIGKSNIRFIYDYEKSSIKDVVSEKLSKVELPKSNLMIFESEDGSRVAIRPSGTEPKIKFYFSVNTKLESKKDFSLKEDYLNKKIKLLVDQFV